jgi:hypothetical protein
MAIHGEPDMVRRMGGQQMAQMIGALFAAAYDFGRHRGIEAWELQVMPELLDHLETLGDFDRSIEQDRSRAALRLAGSQLLERFVRALSHWVNQHLKAS